MLGKLLIKKKEIFIIISFFLVTRFIILFILEIHPDQNTLSTSWQLVNLYFLKNYYLESILYLNFQPPLFNLIVGFLFFIFKTITVVAITLHIFNIFITILILLLLIKISKSSYLKKRQIIFLSLFIIFNPAIFLYENYIGNYTHLVSLILIVIFYFSKKYFENYHEKYEIFIYLLLTSLVYIWSVFTPFVLLIFFLTLIFFKIKNKFEINKSIAIFIIFLILSILPSIKNYIFFKYFSNGSHGLGWHLAMTTSSIKGDFKLHNNCVPFKNTETDNQEYYKKNNLDEKKLSITNKSDQDFYNRNQLGRIIRMEKCKEESIKYIKDNAGLWIKGRIKEFIISHGQFAIDISFIIGHPKNFDKYNNILIEIHKNKVNKTIKQSLLIFYFFSIYVYFFYFIFFYNKKKLDNYAYIFIFCIYFYIVGIGTIFSNYEGSRFIQAGYIVQILFWINVIKKYNNSKIKLF